MGLFVILVGCTGTSAPEDTAPGADTGSDAGEDSGADNIGGDTGAGDTAEEPDDTGPNAADEAAYAALYDEGSLTQIVIELSAADETTMTAEVLAAREAGDPDPEFTYVSAAITVNGLRLENVGLRVKGGDDAQEWSEKPSLKLKFDEFEDELRYAGLKRITLENMADDPAMCRDVIGFHAWRDAGMPAPQANFAQVHLVVDGGPAAYLGLYANIEAMDSRWLARNYSDAGGDLWEAGDSADFSEPGLRHFSLVAGEGDTDTLDAARDQIQNHGDDVYAAADAVLDMDAFFEFWTLSVALGNRDGYPFHLDDFFVYRNPADERFQFAPATMAESFDSGTPVYARYVVGAVGQACLYYDEACADRYVAALKDTIDDVEASDLAAFAAATQALTALAVQDDARKNANEAPLTTAQVEAARTTLNDRIVAYPERLRTGLGL